MIAPSPGLAEDAAFGDHTEIAIRARRLAARQRPKNRVPKPNPTFTGHKGAGSVRQTGKSTAGDVDPGKPRSFPARTIASKYLGSTTKLSICPASIRFRPVSRLHN